MIDDSMIPDGMPKADEYNAAAEKAVAEALGGGKPELFRALKTMIDFTGALVHIIEKAVDDNQP